MEKPQNVTPFIFKKVAQKTPRNLYFQAERVQRVRREINSAGRSNSRAELKSEVTVHARALSNTKSPSPQRLYTVAPRAAQTRPELQFN